MNTNLLSTIRFKTTPKTDENNLYNKRKKFSCLYYLANKIDKFAT